MKKILMILILVFIIAGNTLAMNPVDYLIVYQYSLIQDGKTDKSISKIYCQGNTKVRMEMENFFWKKTNGDEVSSKSLSISIIRLDRKVNWLLDLEKKICRELPITPQSLNKNPNYSLQNWKNKLTKIGEEKFLNYDCEVYTSIGSYPSKYWFSKDYNIMLKTESEIEGNKSIIEAVELRFEKQNDSLFEIPQDYEVIKLKVTTQEELDKQPPVTLSDIEKSLFADMKSLQIGLSKFGRFRELAADEIKIIRDSFISGSDLAEVTNKEISEVWKINENPTFILKCSGNLVCNFWYDKVSGYIFVNKSAVFHKEWKEHEMDFKWLKKYAQGAYKFKPSKEFEIILK
jgi:hypothetical protein